ncbi:MAG: hypothetical protein IT462_07305 [Planctomycetes bacterium]|nr:hypothetical protein [Planctomycetota bacterium]
MLIALLASCGPAKPAPESTKIVEEFYPGGRVLKSRTTTHNAEGKLSELIEEHWYESGQQSFRAVYLGSQREDGDHQRWYPNGQTQALQQWDKEGGKGVFRGWYESGALRSFAVVTMNISGSTWHHGEAAQWWENGLPKEIGQYKYGRKDGSWRYFDEKGVMTMVEENEATEAARHTRKWEGE